MHYRWISNIGGLHATLVLAQLFTTAGRCHEFFFLNTFVSLVVLLKLTKTSSPYQFLEEVAHTLLVAPVLDSGQQSIVEVLVDLVKLWHFEEDGLYLLDGQHRLGSCGCGPQRLHGLDK